MGAIDALRAPLGLTAASVFARQTARMETLLPTVTAADDAMGPLARSLVRLLLERLCIEPGVGTTFPLSCTSPDGSLIQLRTNLLRDLGAIGETQLRRSGTLDTPPVKWAAQILELVDLTLLSPDLRAWLDRVPALLTNALSCSEGTCPEQTVAIEITVDILTRSLRDGFGRGLPDEHFENIAEEVLRDHFRVAASNPDHGNALGFLLSGVEIRSPALTEARERARQLAALLREIEELTVRLKDSPQPLAASITTPLVLKNLQALRQAWRIAEVGQRIPEFPLRPELLAEVQPLVAAIVSGDWNRIVAGIHPQLETLEAQQLLPRGSVRAFDSAARFANARTEDDLKRAARDLVLPLPPWMDRWVVDLNASWPRLASNNFLLNGDLTLGYNGERFGIVARGTALSYDLTTQAGLTQTEQYEGSAEGWFLLPLGSATALDLRGNVGASIFDTTVVQQGSPFGDQTSLMGRAVTVVGLRFQAGRVAAYLGGGAGFQYEDYSALNVMTVRRAVLLDQNPWTLRGEGHVKAQWNAIPDILSLRLRADLSYLQITRDDRRVVVGTGSSKTHSVTRSEQTQLVLRGFLDVDALRFFGFLPSLHGGLNYVQVGSDGSITPVIGVGIRREAL